MITLNSKTPQQIFIGGKEVQSLAIFGEIVWTNEPYDYFYIQNEYAGANTFTVTKVNNPSCEDLSYSKDKSTWTDIHDGGTVSLDQGEKAYLRSSTGLGKDGGNYYKFNCSENFSIGGNFMTLIDYTNDVTTIPNYGLYDLFDNSTTLISVSNANLGNVTIINEGGFRTVFLSCTSLTDIIDLSNITTIGDGGCWGLFQNCPQITNTPQLTNLTTVGVNSLRNLLMSTGVTSSPDIRNVTSYTTNSFTNIVRGASNVSVAYVPENLSTWDTTIFENWLGGVAASGVVYKPAALSIPTDSTSGVPTGWTVELYDADYFHIKNTSNETGVFKMVKNSTPSYTPNLEYSLDGATWTTYDFTNLPDITVNAGANIFFRGTNANNQFNYNNSMYYKFSFDKTCEAYGNICSLFDDDPEVFSTITTVGDYGLVRLFSQMTTLTKAPDLSHITSVGNRGMQYMFYQCPLISAPDLSNLTTIGDNGLQRCFAECSVLTTGPDLSNVTSVGQYCLNNCFYGCSNISTVTAPNVQDLTTGILGSWLSSAGTSATGTKTVRIPTGATITADSENGVPTGWTTQDY